MQTHFNSSIEAFKYFLPSDINKTNSLSKSYTSSFSTQSTNSFNRNYITKKNFSME